MALKGISMRQGLAPVLCLALALASAGGIAADGAATSATGQIAAQARYWEQKGRYDLARESWLKLLRAEPDNATALSGLATAEIRSGRPEMAQQYLQGLRQIKPDSPDLRRLEGLVAAGAVGDDQLRRARELARAGRYDESVAEYRRVLGGEAPEGPLALEYWQTLAGTKDGWAESRAGLEKLVQDQPQNADYRLALAQHLTYREETRRQGLDQLMNLADNDTSRQPVQPVWRQALLWLGARPSDARYYQAYLKRYGDDTQVSTRLASGRSGGVDVAGGSRPPVVDVRGRELKRAWSLVDAGKIEDAEQAFSTLSKRNPRDAEALAGLGVIRLRQDRFAEARDYLQQATRLSPGRASQWSGALAAARFWEQVRLAEADRSAGDLPAAEQRLRAALTQAPAIAAQEPSVRLTLADLLLAQDRPQEAESLYRRVLQGDPANVDAARGLMTVLTATDRNDQALAYYQGLSEGQQEAIGSITTLQAKALRQKAALALAARDEAGAERLLREAISADPDSTWARLDLGRLYLSQSRREEARSLIDGLPVSGPLRGEASYVRAVMAAEEQGWYDGLMWLEQVPEAERTSAMSALQKRLWVRYQTERAAVYARQGYRDEALGLLSGVEPYARSPELVGSVALAYAAAGEKGRGLYLLRQSLAGNPTPDPDLRLAYAGLLLQLNQSSEFDAQMDQLARLPQLSRQQEGALTELRITQRLRQADAVRLSGNLARAYELLEPALRANPDDPRLVMALARLYDQSAEHDRSLALYRYALQLDPRNLDAYQGAVQASLALGQEGEADRWLAQALRVAPDSSRLYVLAGRLAKSRGEDGRALALFQRALELGPGSDGPGTGRGALRLQVLDANLLPVSQRGVRGTLRPAVRHARGDAVLAPPTRFAQGGLIKVGTRPQAVAEPVEVAQATPTLPPLLPPGYKLPPVTPAPAASPTLKLDVPRTFIPPPQGPEPLKLRLDDALRSSDYAYQQPPVADTATDEVLREIASINSQRTAWVGVGLGLRNRDGTSGLDRLDDIEMPMEASIAGVDAGRFTFRVVPVYLDAGTVSGGSLPLFGRLGLGIAQDLATNAATPLVPAGTNINQNDAGVAMGVVYNAGTLTLDVGSSPLGFEITNIVGGARWTPQSGPWIFDIDLSRRPVTDSLLSYAGTREPLTGKRWGGVTASGGHLDIAYDWGDVGLYGGAGFHVYDGKNVPSNNQSEVGGGVYLTVLKLPQSKVTAGINATGIFFDENLRRFSFGHGGYFSPKRYVALALPVEWTGGHTRYSWTLNGSIGMQSFREDGAALYPDNAGLQKQIEDLVKAADPVTEAQLANLATGYGSRSSNSVGMSFGGSFEYLIAPNIAFGAKASFDNAKDYDESRLLAYLRFTMSPQPAVSVPPRPVIPFADFGRRGP